MNGGIAITKKNIIIGTLLVLLTAYLYYVPLYKYEANREINQYMQQQGLSKKNIAKNGGLEKSWKMGWYTRTLVFTDDPDINYYYMYSRSYDQGYTGVHLESFDTYDSHKKPLHPPLKGDPQDRRYLD